MTKRLILLALCCFALYFSTNAQHIGMTLSVDASKTFKIKSKWRVRLSQRLQLNPEIEKFESLYGGLFNEIYPFPHNDDNDDDKADDDDGNSTGVVGISDSPYDVRVEWRTASSLRGEYHPFKWLRVRQSYVLNGEKDEIRHAFRNELGLNWLDTKKLKCEHRFTWQSVSEKRKGKTKWEEDFSTSANLQWEFKKKHSLYFSPGFNFRFKDKALQADRLCVGTGLKFQFSKQQSFSFGYLFQQRLSGKRKGDTSNGLSFVYGLSF